MCWRRTVVMPVVAFALAAAACAGHDERLVVAAGTTVVDSGVVDRLAAAYESSVTGMEVSVIGRSTREVLDLGSRRAADVLVSHAPDQEAGFLQQHPDATSHPLFASRFLLVGPPGRSRDLDGLAPEEALGEISRQQWAFVTRADGSGTFDAESELWSAAGVDPTGEQWYRETGQGMGLSLQVADQTEAFILVEEGTFLAASAILHLRPVELAPGTHPINPYVAIVPVPTRAADAFVAWLLSDAGRAALTRANRDLFGSAVFASRATPDRAP